VNRVRPSLRVGAGPLPGRAHAWLSERTGPAPSEWALGIEARLRALLSNGEAAERCYRRSIARLGRTRLRVELARSHLLYGEWLRRQRRRLEAREQLRTANDLLEAMGIEGFAKLTISSRGELGQALSRDSATAKPE
jgi:hypothetical protein